MDRVNKNKVLGQNIPFIFWFGPWERKRERMRGSKSSFYDPQSSVGRNSSSQELKFIASMRATRVYQKTRGFIEDPKEEILRNKRFWA